MFGVLFFLVLPLFFPQTMPWPLKKIPIREKNLLTSMHITDQLDELKLNECSWILKLPFPLFWMFLPTSRGAKEICLNSPWEKRERISYAYRKKKKEFWSWALSCLQSHTKDHFPEPWVVSFWTQMSFSEQLLYTGFCSWLREFYFSNLGKSPAVMSLMAGEKTTTQ